MDANTLSTFVDDILKDKYGPNVPADETSEMKQGLMIKLNEWITLKTMTELAKVSQESLTQFQAMAQDKTSSAGDIQKFVQEKIPNQQAFLTQTLLEFRNTYMGESQGA